MTARARQLVTYGQDRLTTPAERRLAGRIGGVVWLLFAVTLLVMLRMPGLPIEHGGAVVLLAVVAVVAGTACVMLVPWERVPRAAVHVSSGLGLLATALVGPLTGGEESPTHEYLWFVLVYAAFFYALRPALAYWAGCVAVSAMPLLYDSAALGGNLARELLIVIPLYLIVGAIVFAGREVQAGLSRRATRLGAEQQRLAEEQSSLRRVATAVAAGSPPQAIFTLVSSEVGRLLGADAAAIARYLSEERLQMMGVWQGRTEAAQVLELDPDDELARVRTATRPIRIDRYEDGAISRARALGYGSLIVAPVSAGMTRWGALVVAARRAHAFAPGDEERLRDYADLIATAVANAEDRARLDRQAGVDALTGLPNHRALRDRLENEVCRARRHGRPLTVAVVDVDRFRELTDRVGHDEGEQTLAEIARLLRSAVRDEDIVARLGADEFGIAFVESDRATALLAADRARHAIGATRLRHGERVTVSVGLCDLEAAPSADELLRRADAALFWSKEHGRDRSWVYDPSVARDLAGYARRRALDDEHALAGLRALARAIDAKDPATHEHSERVATLAGRLATMRGWDEVCVERLREAAVLHDVGKVGVPDAVLLKPGPLDDCEMGLMREHAALGARIVADMLDDAQVEWIAAHHERPDGRGYPRGLTAQEIPEGAALIALADAWDSMVSGRTHRPRRDAEDALGECRALVGRQFTAEALEALEALHAHGGLVMAAMRMHRPTAVPEPHAA
jgi:diguanylate cyclase (GGDEF)-like protein/putative nucleotidyltransferase with HDIG domain